MPLMAEERPSEFKMPDRVEQQRLAEWKKSPEFAEIRAMAKKLDEQMNMNKKIRRHVTAVIPTLPAAEERAIIQKILKKGETL